MCERADSSNDHVPISGDLQRRYNNRCTTTKWRWQIHRANAVAPVPRRSRLKKGAYNVSMSNVTVQLSPREAAGGTMDVSNIEYADRDMGYLLQLSQQGAGITLNMCRAILVGAQVRRRLHNESATVAEPSYDSQYSVGADPSATVRGCWTSVCPFIATL